MQQISVVLKLAVMVERSRAFILKRHSMLTNVRSS